MINLKSIEFPVLKTERLSLRPIKESDVQELFELHSDESVRRYTGLPVDKSLEDTQGFLEKIVSGMDEKKFVMWAVTKLNEDKLIGTICFWMFQEEFSRCAIGYELMPKFHGHGLMQEAIEAIIHYGFDILKLDVIEAEVSPDNNASVRILTKNGFLLDTELENTVVYTLDVLKWNEKE